jgi:hypothetical protein
VGVEKVGCVKKLGVAAALMVALLVPLPGAAFATNDYSAWASCQHGLSVELSRWPKAYTVTITNDGAPVINSANQSGAKFSHTENDKSNFALGNRTVRHAVVIEVTTAEQDKSFTSTIDMPACGAAWPGYDTPDGK